MGNSRWFLSCLALVALGAVALAPVAASADPAISGFSSNTVPLNSYLQIYGSGFGDAQGSSYVTIGGRFVPVVAWTDGVITIVVNPLAYNQGSIVLDTAYPVQIVIPSTGKSSNTLNLTISSAAPFVNNPGPVDQITRSDQPVITGFQTTVFDTDSALAIYGSGFGDAQGSGYVSVTVPFMNNVTEEIAIPVLGWSENAINALLLLPAGAQPGTYTVTVHRSNGKTASDTFTVVPEEAVEGGD